MKEWKRSVAFHMVLISLFMLLLLIPLSWVEGLIHERESVSVETTHEIQQDWSATQEIAGFVLTLPYEKTNEKGEATTGWLHFAPEELAISGSITPSILYRSLYEVPVYESDLTISGSFLFPDTGMGGVAEQKIAWDRAFISLQISDLKGVSDKATVTWDQTEIPLRPGTGRVGILSNGLSAPVSLTELVEKKSLVQGKTITVRELQRKKERFPFSLHLKLKGSSGLFFSPMGKTTVVNLRSSWSSPKFEGNILPTIRNVSDKGFEAQWKVLNYNRDIPESWTEDSPFTIGTSMVGVTLFLEVNDYSKSDRTVKYGFLFILLTYLAFFFSEIFSRVHIHPIQYTLVGVALCLFYLLLTALSEHISFNAAYFVSSIAVTALISFFTGAIYRNKKIGGLIAATLTLLYGFIFVILHSYNYALLAGSIGLFVILSLIMYLSRRIDWYSLMNRGGEEIKKTEDKGSQV